MDIIVIHGGSGRSDATTVRTATLRMFALATY